MICNINRNGYCQRHDRIHAGVELGQALSPTKEGEQYRILWDNPANRPWLIGHPNIPTVNPAVAAANTRDLVKEYSDCVYRGEKKEDLICGPCGGKTKIFSFVCKIHGRCHLSLGKHFEGVTCCIGCKQHISNKAFVSPEIVPGIPDPIPEPNTQMGMTLAHTPEVKEKHIAAFRKLLSMDIPFQGKVEGDGIIMVGDTRHWPMVYISVNMIREVSNLPIQVWYLGGSSPVERIQKIPNVTFHSANSYPHRIMGAWECKYIALLNCGFQRALYIDADAYPITDPQPLLELVTEETPFAFWSDLPSFNGNAKWEPYGLDGDGGVPSVQGGQFIMNIKHFYRELVLNHWYNQHRDYTYHHGFGDQDGLRVVLRATGRSYMHLGGAKWDHPALLCHLKDKLMIVHRCQGKLWDVAMNKQAFNLPKERQVWKYLVEWQNSNDSSILSLPIVR